MTEENAPLPPPRVPSPRAHLSVHHFGMFQDGDDIAHDGDAQLVQDLLIQVHQHVRLDPVQGKNRKPI